MMPDRGDRLAGHEGWHASQPPKKDSAAKAAAHDERTATVIANEDSRRAAMVAKTARLGELRLARDAELASTTSAICA